MLSFTEQSLNTVYPADVQQPQQKTQTTNRQDQQLSGKLLPQVARQQVADIRGQTLHKHKLGRSK